jgi:hypothetical protein
MSKKQQKMIQSILDLAVSAKVQYNTYLQYSEAKALNNFNDKTFIKNSIDPQKIYDDFVNIFTAKIDGLYNWCLLLQIGTVAVYKVWFRNIRFTDDDLLIVDPLNLTNANFADGEFTKVEYNTNRNVGNFNDTYSSENLNIEQIRLMILIKYYTQKCSGSIKNIYIVLGKFLSFYYNQHSGLPYNPDKNNTFIVADCLVGSEVQYQGVLYIYYNNLLAEQVDAINPEKESEKIKYVLQFSNILPQNIGQSLRFIYANPLPTDEQLLEYSKKPQQTFVDPNTRSNLSNNVPNNMITKTWCNSGANNTDYKIVPTDGQNQGIVNQEYGFTPNYAKQLPRQAFAETMVDLIDNSNNFNDFKLKFKNEILRLSEKVTAIGDDINDPLAPTRQYMNGIFREIFDNILFYNTGQEIDWSPDVVYQNRAVVRVFNQNNACVYYQSMVDNNTSTIDDGLSNGNWVYRYKLIVNDDKTTIEFINNKISDLGSLLDCEKLDLFDFANNSNMKLRARDLVFQDYSSAYPKLLIDKNQLTWFDGNGNSEANLRAFYSPNGSKAPFYQDIHMSNVIGNITRYGTDSGQSVAQNRILILANGTVISMQVYSVGSGEITTTSYANNTIFKEIPFVIVAPYDTILLDKWRVIETTEGHVTLQPLSSQPPELKFTFFVLAIGTLANYIGDELAKIRAYKVTPYYNKLTENQKQELDQYYINLDETKDLTKVTTPEWLEAELDGKELT